VNCHDASSLEKDAFVEMGKCRNCHGTGDKVKEETRNPGEQNPHNNYIEKLDYTISYDGHSESVLYCVKCRTNLDLKTPEQINIVRKMEVANV
jgi:hypothetical protein